MHKILLTLAVILLVVQVQACVSVDLNRYDLSSPSEARLRQESEASRSLMGRWEEYDLDGDDALSREEWRAKEWRSFLIYDEDGDEALNLREYVRSKCGIRAQLPEFYDLCAPRVVLSFVARTGDNDGSGVLDARGLRNDLDYWFHRNDRNRDGRVDRREFSTPGTPHL